jgi:hypothetical protein
MKKIVQGTIGLISQEIIKNVPIQDAFWRSVYPVET